MRTFDFTPYYRSTVGFDRLFDLLDQSIRSDWPPYNIEKKGEDQYRITMTVAALPRTKSNWSSTGVRSS
jgi:molecular chaperone IbpA